MDDGPVGDVRLVSGDTDIVNVANASRLRSFEQPPSVGTFDKRRPVSVAQLHSIRSPLSNSASVNDMCRGPFSVIDRSDSPVSSLGKESHTKGKLFADCGDSGDVFPFDSVSVASSPTFEQRSGVFC
jgi:hypothetical protein